LFQRAFTFNSQFETDSVLAPLPPRLTD
jgi:hypothetical protein